MGLPLRAVCRRLSDESSKKLVEGVHCAVAVALDSRITVSHTEGRRRVMMLFEQIIHMQLTACQQRRLLDLQAI